MCVSERERVCVCACVCVCRVMYNGGAHVGVKKNFRNFLCLFAFRACAL